MKKNANNPNLFGLPEPFLKIVDNDDPNDLRNYTYAIYKDLTEEDISLFNTMFSDMPITNIMVDAEGTIYYTAYAQSVFMSQNLNYQIVGDNGKRNQPRDIITTDLTLLHQYLPYVKTFMSDDFPIYLTDDSSVKFAFAILNPNAIKIADNVNQFISYMNKNREATKKIKRLLKKSDRVEISPVNPSQKSLLDLRKNSPNFQQNRQKNNNDQNFEQILKDELNKRKG